MVYSTEPRAFGESETAALLLLTRLMVEILSGEPVGREIGTPLVVDVRSHTARAR